MKRHIPLLLFCIVLSVGVLLAPQAGISWDEADNIFAGGVYVTFFKEGFNPHVFDGFWDQRSSFRTIIFTLNPTLSHYPPVANYVGSVITLVAQRFRTIGGPQIVTIFHIATAIFLALMVATVYRFGILLGLTPITALFSALATYLYPMLFGHGLTDLKDTAQTALFTLALYYLVKNKLWKGAIVWGLALATKFNAVYVPVIWGISGIRGIKGINKWILVVCIGFMVAFIVWPYLWFDPVHRIGEVITYFTTVGRGYNVFWYGHMYTVGARFSLWWYPLICLLTMTPITLLILGVFGVVRVVREKERKRKLLLIWFLIPMARIVMPYAAFYDGLRHFMEVIPALMLLAGVGLAGLRGWVKYGVAVLVIAHLLFINTLYFPYSTGYVNILVQSPNSNLDRDIGGLSVKEGIDWLHQTYGDVYIWIPVATHTGWVYIHGGHDQIVRDESMGQFMIVVNKLSHLAIFPEFKTLPTVTGFTLVHTISRGKNVFGWVYRKLPSL